MIRLCLKLCLLLLALPAYAALPMASNVPGGVALIPLGAVIENAQPPQAWLEEQPILVTADKGKWFAVVGLPLDMKTGLYTLRAESNAESTTIAFKVKPKKYPEQHITLKDKGKVELSDEDAKRAVAEIALIKQLKLHWQPSPDTDPSFILPAKGRLSGKFGSRRVFNGQPRAPHAGIDVAVRKGSKVVASAHAKVLAVGDYFFNGKTIFLDHGNGLITMYCHLDRIDVSEQESVRKGQQIALSGKSGRATGPHLHWSVILNGAMVDPQLFLPRSQR
ncbi:MAG: peptidoglycan DD-metalloendopeptidase family protein [Gammaproteobacteria bacterium]|nr:peptidoglycan DD-metalloendopeptidase family protein [Gammaproteobacteria bacterium]MBU1625682.1 peptidoglycan DD-metalloendopeptidase family protein [Gammaproteobacteria bacterium]MBU1980942.1 peptidoglycan DD-metalloendopeptidase family protein [Gammaproteobacteria bacterium]